MSKVIKKRKRPRTVKGAAKGKYIAKHSAGPYAINMSTTLVNIIRDQLGLAESSKEVQKILNEKKIKIDHKTIKDRKRPVGFMDIMQIGDNYYKAIYDKKGRIVPKEIDEKEAKHKLCKVKQKTPTKNGMQITLHDGKNIITDKEASKGSTVELDLDKNKIKKVLPMKKGAKAAVIGGKHAGKEGKIKEIKEGTVTRNPLVEFEEGFSTKKENIFVIGD